MKEQENKQILQKGDGMKANKWIYIAAGLILLGLVWLGIQAERQHDTWTSKQYNCTKWFNNTICVDQQSIYYGCDVEAQFCSENYIKEWQEHTYTCRQVE